MRIAVIDMNNGAPNLGLGAIGEILKCYGRNRDFGHSALSYDVFDLRNKGECPDLSYDVYLSSGGPGDPFEGEGMRWEHDFFDLLEGIVQHNRRMDDEIPSGRKKYALLICHSFQLACRKFFFGKVCRRRSTAFGIFPVSMTSEGREDELFAELPDPFFAVDSRDWQVLTAKKDLTEEVWPGQPKVLALEKERPHVDLERCIMAVRFTPEIAGTQFHPEAGAAGMRSYLLRDEKKSLVTENHGIAKYQEMLDSLDDPDKLELTQSLLLSNFLDKALNALQEVEHEKGFQMVRALRALFNERFRPELYRQLLEGLQQDLGPVSFRVAETPVFIPADLEKKLVQAGEEVLSLISRPDFKAITERAVPERWRIPGENGHPHFLCLDFAVCRDTTGSLSPRLIELQGFPSLYGFQPYLAALYRQVYQLNEGLTPFFGGLTSETYQDLLREVIVGRHAAYEVALMDLDAPGQKTYIDFLLTQRMLGMPILSFSDIFREGRCLYYRNEKGERVRLKRIYNRLIFDELERRPELLWGFDPRVELDVEWATHPNWFYRVSKYTLPFLKGEFVPEAHFVHELRRFPADLENYILKPLFSFAGSGVQLDVRTNDLRKLDHPEQWVLQRKVDYAPVIHTPAGGVKAEIRLMYIWPECGKPQLCINLVRMSRGNMIGVDHNRDLDWVGGSVGLLQR